MVAIGVLATGCAWVPVTGPVEHYQPQQGGTSSGVEVAPLPPVDGATQLLVVEGFLHAMGTYEAGYQVARQYLTTQAARIWRPESGVQVYADGSPPVETDQSVVLVATISGSVDASGIYSTSGRQLRHDFGLVKNESGQWRISNPPQGLLVSRYLFGTGFLAVNTYFTAASGNVLLPDPRYVASGPVTLTTAVEAVLAGPSPWLSPIVAPRPGRDVSLTSVVLEPSGTAQVLLSASANALVSDRREQLLAELTFTLCSFEQVRTVQVSSGGFPWANADGRTLFTPSSFASVDPVPTSGVSSAFIANGSSLRRQVSQGNWTDFVEVQGGLPEVTGLAISPGSQSWAALADRRTRVIGGDLNAKAIRTIRTGAGMLRPFYSRTGELWSVAQATSAWRVYRGETVITPTVRGLPKGEIVGASLSPDGERLAVVVSTTTTTVVGLLRVRRTETTIEVEGWYPIALNPATVSAARIVDLGWSSVNDLVLLRRDSTSETNVSLVSQDGSQITELGPSDAAGLISLAAVAGRPPLAVGAGGQLYRFDGEFNWLVTANDVDAAAYPG